MVRSLGNYAVWLSFLALHCLYSVFDSGQLLPSLVDRHSVPWACLPLPPLVPVGLIDVVSLGRDFLMPGLPSFGWIRHSVPWACLPLSWVDVVCLDGSLRGMGCPPSGDQDHWRVQSLGVDAVWLCFPCLLACCAALGYYAFPIVICPYRFSSWT